MARKSYYEIDALFPLVEKIVERLDAKTPEDLSLSKFDKARVELGYEDAPEGRVIARRFKMSWSEFARVATDTRIDFRRSVGRRLGEPERKLRDNEVIYALWLVARRLGQETVAEDQYRRERKKLVASSDRHASELGVRLPNHDQIRTYVGGDWKQALKLAAMEEPTVERGVSGEDVVIEVFLQFGTRVTRQGYWDFCKANDIAAAPPKHLEKIIERAEERLQADGLTLPKRIWRETHPDYTQPVSEFRHLKDPPRHRMTPTYEGHEFIDAFCAYYRGKDPNSIANWPDYDDFARERGLPGKSLMGRKGTLAEFVDAAEDRLAEERAQRRTRRASQVAPSSAG